MSDDTPPTCDRDGCDEDSRFLLTCGDRCREHAIEDQPDTVHFVDVMGPEVPGDV